MDSLSAINPFFLGHDQFVHYIILSYSSLSYMTVMFELEYFIDEMMHDFDTVWKNHQV